MAAAAGVFVYLLVARPWGAVAGVVAVAASCALAVAVAYDADLLVSPDAATAEYLTACPFPGCVLAALTA